MTGLRLRHDGKTEVHEYTSILRARPGISKYVRAGGYICLPRIASCFTGSFGPLEDIVESPMVESTAEVCLLCRGVYN
jgi:hypothetical protein